MFEGFQQVSNDARTDTELADATYDIHEIHSPKMLDGVC